MSKQLTVRKMVKVPVDTLRMTLSVRYDDEDMPRDFPFRKNNAWSVEVDLATYRIKDWPQGRTAEIYMKVCDEGHYELWGDGQFVAECDGYVPHGLVPGEYGDYIDLKIGADGTILNKPRALSTSEFVEECDE